MRCCSSLASGLSSDTVCAFVWLGPIFWIARSIRTSRIVLLAGATHESVAERFTNTAEEVVAFLLCEVLLVALKFADGIDHDPAIVEDRDSAGGTRILVREEESGNLGNPFLPFPDETTLTMSTGSIELGGHFVCVPPIFCHHDAFSWKDSLAFRRCSSCTAISL